jgi:hypothetical protein
MILEGYFAKDYWSGDYWSSGEYGYWPGDTGIIIVVTYDRIEAKVYNILKSDAGILAIAGTRVYPSTMPQKATFPLVTLRTVGGGLAYHLQGYATLENPRFNIQCYGVTYAIAKNLANAIISAMEGATGFSAIMDNDTDIYEDSTEKFGVSMEFSVWHNG